MEEIEQDVDYQPLPLRACKTIRVTVKHTGEFAPVPYPVEANVIEDEELEQA